MEIIMFIVGMYFLVWLVGKILIGIGYMIEACSKPRPVTTTPIPVNRKMSKEDWERLVWSQHFSHKMTWEEYKNTSPTVRASSSVSRPLRVVR